MTRGEPVMSSVPTIACSAPPPSPTTLRIELVKNVRVEARASPLATTVQSSEIERDQRDRRTPTTTSDGDEPVGRLAAALDERARSRR